MKKEFSLIKIVGFNAVIFFIFILLLELFFGSWINFLTKKKSKIPIPALIINETLYFNPEKINKDNKKIIQYKRNNLGYRSYDVKTKKTLFLSIGGSTTDQQFITEGNTWQDKLDEKFPKYEFINGGVGGHSSYGHYISLENWHSRYLDSDDVKFILYYIGLNDVSLLKNEDSKTNKIFNFYEKSKFTVFKNFLKENSFFAKRIYILRNKLGLIDLNANIFNSHFMRKEDFLKEGKILKIENNNYLDDYPEYKSIFTNLIKYNFKFFPDSNVFIVQQQIPGCKYINSLNIIDRHPNDRKYCLNLLKVYNLQKYYLKEYLSEYKITLIEMYKENILGDNHVYDYIHTNELGSAKIAEYIESRIKSDLIQ